MHAQHDGLSHRGLEAYRAKQPSFVTVMGLKPRAYSHVARPGLLDII